MKYVNGMKKEEKKEENFVVSSIILVVNEENKILLERNKSDNFWKIPGGIMLPHEVIEDTTRRVAYEQNSLILEKLDLIGILSGDEVLYKKPNGDEIYNVIALYKSGKYNGSIYSKNSNVILNWFSIYELPDIDSMSNIIFDKIVKKEIKF